MTDNITTNIIKIEGENEEINKFKNDIKSDSLIIDFNKICSIPDNEYALFDDEDISSFSLSDFDSLISNYVKLGSLYIIKNNKNCIGNTFDILKYIKLKINHLDIRNYAKEKVFYYFYRLLLKNYSEFFINLTKLYNSNNNMDELIKDIHEKIKYIKNDPSNDDKDISINNDLLDKLGLFNRDEYTSKGLYCLILISKYFVLNTKEFKVLYWGCSSNANCCNWEDNNTLVFCTSNLPFPIFSKINETYKDLKITCYSINNDNKVTNEFGVFITSKNKGKSKYTKYVEKDYENYKELLKYIK